MQIQYGNAREFLEKKAAEYPHLAIRPVHEPDPMQMEQSIGFFLFGNWIAGTVDGMMHWRFALAQDLETFEERYPDAISR